MKAASIAHLFSSGRGRGRRRRTAARPMLLEQLESRVNLSTAPLLPTIESTIGAEGDSPWLASVAAPASQEIVALTTSSAAVFAALTAKNRAWTSSVDVVVPSLPDATSLRLEAAGGLTFWNGRQKPTFIPARANVRLDLSLGGQTLAVRAGEPQPTDAAALTLAAAATNRVAARIAVAGQPARAPAAGWYAVSTNVVAPNGGPATPVTLLFSLGAAPAGSRAAAIRAVGGVGATPTAVTVGVTLAPPPAVAPIVVPPETGAPVAPTAVAPQAPVVQSTPAFVLPPAVNGIVEVSSDITSSVTFSAGTIYVITAEVHVRKGVTLTIDDGVEVRIRNGRASGRLLTARALIFDAGSSLRAQNVVFQAADDANQPVAVANNGGVFFCGGTRTATKDNVSSQDLKRSRIGWSFVANSITANYLGRSDPRGGDGDGHTRDDIDAVSVIGVVFQEWQVRSLTANHSGDDGFDLTNASIAMENVRVFAPVEDGLNLTTSLLQIKTGGRLEIDMTGSTARDREIFDFEVDTGPAQISIAPGAAVEMSGYWDNSPGDLRIDVRSFDMPRPPLWTREWYAFSGILVRSALIFSVP